MRIALYGGSFNPPHVCHLLAATWVLATQPVDELWVAPVGQHPLNKPMAASLDDRLALCRLNFAVLGQRVRVIDAERGSTGRTLDLLDRLQAHHPDAAFRLVLGADILQEAGRWHRFDEVARRAPPLVLGREGYAIPPEFVGEVAPLVLPALSSSAVRRALACGGLPKGWLVGDVEAEIRRRGLYLEPLPEAL